MANDNIQNSAWTSAQVSTNTIPGDSNSLNPSLVSTTDIYTGTPIKEEQELEILSVLDLPSDSSLINKTKAILGQTVEYLQAESPLTDVEIRALTNISDQDIQNIENIVKEVETLKSFIFDVSRPTNYSFSDSSVDIEIIQNNIDALEQKSIKVISNKVIDAPAVSLSSEIENLKSSIENNNYEIDKRLHDLKETEYEKQAFFRAVDSLAINGIDVEEYDYTDDTLLQAIFKPRVYSATSSNENTVQFVGQFTRGSLGPLYASANPSKHSDADTGLVSEPYSNLRFINYSLIQHVLRKWHIGFSSETGSDNEWNNQLDFWNWCTRDYPDETPVSYSGDNQVATALQGSYSTQRILDFLINSPSNSELPDAADRKDLISNICAVGYPTLKYGSYYRTFAESVNSYSTRDEGNFFIINAASSLIPQSFFDEKKTKHTNLQDNKWWSSLYNMGLQTLRIVRYILHKTIEFENEIRSELGVELIDGTNTGILTNKLNAISSYIDLLPENNDFTLDFSLATNNRFANLRTTGNNTLRNNTSLVGTLDMKSQAFVNAYIEFQKLMSQKKLIFIGENPSKNLSFEFLPPQVFRDFQHVMKNTKFYDPMQYVEKPVVEYLDPMYRELSDNSDNEIKFKYQLFELTKEITIKSTRLENIEFSELLQTFTKNGTIDIYLTLKYFDKWKTQVGASTETYKWNFDTLLAEKYEAILELDPNILGEENYSTINKIVIVSVPYEVSKAGLRLKTSDYGNVSPVSPDEEKILLSVLHAHYGLDFSIDNFPINKKINIPVYPDILIDDKSGKWPWANTEFKDGYPQSTVDNRLLASSFLFSDYYLKKSLCTRRFSDIAIFTLNADVAPLEIRIEENT